MKSGKRFPSRNFILFSQKSENPFHRLGIVVKKEVGMATYRNRIKRYLREFFRLHKGQIQGSFDLVLLVKKGMSRSNDTEKLKKSLEGFLEYEQENGSSPGPKRTYLADPVISAGPLPSSLDLVVVLFLLVLPMLPCRFSDLES